MAARLYQNIPQSHVHAAAIAASFPAGPQKFGSVPVPARAGFGVEAGLADVRSLKLAAGAVCLGGAFWAAP